MRYAVRKRSWENLRLYSIDTEAQQHALLNFMNTTVYSHLLFGSYKSVDIVCYSTLLQFMQADR